MTDIDPYDKITELTNERNEAQAKVRELEGVSARHDALKGDHEAALQVLEDVKKRLKEARQEAQKLQNDASNADSARMAAEEERNGVAEELQQLKGQLDKAHQAASEAADVRDEAVKRAEDAELAVEQLKSLVAGFIGQARRDHGIT